MNHTKRHISVLVLAAMTVLLALGAASAHASYSIARVGTELQLTGDGASDTVLINRDAAGLLRVDIGADGNYEHVGASTVANTTRIVVDAAGGDDVVVFSEVFGALPAGLLTGGDGADTLTGGSGNDQIFGDAGNDSMLGKTGFDELHGGVGDDSATGGDADDTVHGEGGDDTSIWNPGDDSDDFAGGDGSDREQVNGGNGSEIFTLTRNAATTGFAFHRIDPAPFTVDAVGVERVELRMNGGADTFTGDNNLAGFLETVQIETGTGSGSPEIVNGTDVSDVLVGGPGSAQFSGKEGADAYRWSSGDGSDDTVDLGPGTDELSVTGSDNAEQFVTEYVAGTLRLTIPGEIVEVYAAGAERLTLDAAGGDDLYNPAAALADFVAVDASGGPGADTMLGSSGGETLRGGDGDDTITARGGADALFGDAGIDTMAGGEGPDSFACGGFGDTFDATPEDTVAADCLKPADPEPTTPDPDVEPELPPGFKGFSQPVVRRSARGLVVTVANTHTAPITVRVGGTESASRASRVFRYRAVTRTIAPGVRTKITLRAPRKLTRLLKRNLARTGRIVRRPRIAVTNVATAGKTTVRPRLVVKAR